MTKTVRLRKNKITALILQTNGKFMEYDKTNLLVEDTGYRQEDIIADKDNVTLYNLKVGSPGIDLTNPHSTVSVSYCYVFYNASDEVEMSIEIADKLSKIVEEVI